MNELTDESKDRLNAMPFLADAEDSIWEQAQKIRDQFATVISDALDEHGIEALVSVSQPGEFPIQVGLDVWLCVEDLSDSRRLSRQSFTVTVDANPFLEHPMLYTIHASVNGRTYTYTDWDFGQTDILELTLWAIKEGERPSYFKFRLLPDGRKNKPVEYIKPPFMTLERGLGVAGAAMILMGFGISVLLSLIGAGLIGYALYRVSRRSVQDSVVKRPRFSPRRLFLLDSWHASIPGTGDRYDDLRQRIETKLSAFDATIDQRWERYLGRTPYGVEWRERLTLTKGQAEVHIHFHPVADQAFVGWDGYLNWARWVEGDTVASVVNGARVTNYRNIDVGPYIPSQFDLIEFNVLSEMVHGQIVAVLRNFLKEREIEAEIDFSIIRGDRDNALTVGRDGKGSKRRRLSTTPEGQ